MMIGIFGRNEETKHKQEIIETKKQINEAIQKERWILQKLLSQNIEILPELLTNTRQMLSKLVSKN